MTRFSEFYGRNSVCFDDLRKIHDASHAITLPTVKDGYYENEHCRAK